MPIEQPTGAEALLVTRFAAPDEESAESLATVLHHAAAAAAREHGNVSYRVEVDRPGCVAYALETWATMQDARNHEMRARGDGSLTGIRSLLRADPETWFVPLTAALPLTRSTRRTIPARDASAPPEIQWAGRTVLVTGAGTGMGLQAARRFDKLGCRVVMVARNADRLRDEANTMSNALTVPCDITDLNDVARLLDLCRESQVDAALLNAGLTHTYRLFGHTDAVAAAEQEMRTNFHASLRLILGLVPVLETAGNGLLIVTTSGAAFAPDITNPTYSASKAALHSLVQSVRLQLARDRSTISVVEFMAPLVDTPFSGNVESDAKMSAAEAVDLMLDGVAQGDTELHVGATASVYEALRTSSEAAVTAVNSSTGG